METSFRKSRRVRFIHFEWLKWSNSSDIECKYKEIIKCFLVPESGRENAMSVFVLHFRYVEEKFPVSSIIEEISLC